MVEPKDAIPLYLAFDLSLVKPVASSPMDLKKDDTSSV
jgi:hypothetical protein